MNIYVGNLSFEATEPVIREEFSTFGAVSEVNVVTDRETGRSRGFCFVEMPNEAEAREAISSLNLQRIAGRAVTVNEARPRAERTERRGPRRY
ncbi:MAG: RNA-binding protein [Pirellulaceae bacterium]|jgi:RNA recognition motif-containing protein|nr:RNA-binding protein [Pirellulaceae bacterium]